MVLRQNGKSLDEPHQCRRGEGGVYFEIDQSSYMKDQWGVAKGNEVKEDVVFLEDNLRELDHVEGLETLMSRWVLIIGQLLLAVKKK